MTHSVKQNPVDYEAYLGPGYAVAPGLGNLLFTPACDLAPAVSAFKRASKVGDAEGKKDASIRICAAPLTFAQSVGALFILFSEHIPAWSHWLIPLVVGIALPLLILGVAICGFESIFEGTYIKRSLQLLMQTHTGQIHQMSQLLAIADPHERADEISRWIANTSLARIAGGAEIEQLKTLMVQGALLTEAEPIIERIRDRLIVSDLKYLEKKYLVLNDKDHKKIAAIVAKGTKRKTQEELENTELAVKKAKLARRVMPWCANEVQKELKPLLAAISNPALDKVARATAIQKAEELLTTVNIQSKKKLIVHVVGLIGILLTGLVLIVKLWPVFVLYIAAGLLSLAFMYAQGTLDERGWSFSMKKAFVPGVILRLWDKHMKKEEAVAAPPLDPVRIKN